MGSASGSAAGEKDYEENTLPGEAQVGAEVGSEQSTDVVDEDLNKDDITRATGFIGKNADIQWLLRANEQLEPSYEESEAQGLGPFGPPGDTDEALQLRLSARRIRQGSFNNSRIISSSTYHLDTDPVWFKEQYLDPEVLPEFEVAQDLVKGYFDAVHDSFPILNKTAFLRDFDTLYREGAQWQPTSKITNKTRAAINLVFAISARWSHLVGARLGHEDAHIIYSTRARSLALTAESWVQQPDLQQTQLFGLLSFYFMAISQPNRYVCEALKEMEKRLVDKKLYKNLQN